MLSGNTFALVVGERSAAFWREQDAARRELIADVLRGRGLDDISATVPMRAAANGLAQAMLLRDAAFLRLVESGGPISLHGRRRAVLDTWERAADRVLRHVQIIGLTREPAPAMNLHDYMAQRAAEVAAERQQNQARLGDVSLPTGRRYEEEKRDADDTDH